MFNTFAAIFCYNNQGYIFHYSPTVSGMYTASYIFQYLNVYYSEQLEALWDCFSSHYTESIFQLHFISLSAIQNLLRKHHCCGDSFLQALGLCLAWLLRAAEFIKTLPRNEETSWGDVKTASWLLLWSSPFFFSPDVQKKERQTVDLSATYRPVRPFGIIMEAESI